jgi:mgtE-like transporter
MFKETSLACLFDIGSLIAGFMIALQLGLFQLSPWAIALYPAVISVRGVITGLLTGRLSTALHLGTVYPRFSKNTKTFYKLIGAMVVLTLATSATISVIAIIFGTVFWGITFADFSSILTVIIATLSLGLLVTLITVGFTFFSFKRSLDPDTIVYPAMSTVANIVMTFLYIAVLHLYFSSGGQWIIILFGLINVFLVLFILPLNIKEKEFRQVLRESLPTMLLVAFTVNITGTLFRGVSDLAGSNREIYTIYPPMIDTIGDAGLVLGSAATVKLTLGVLTPNFGSIKYHLKNVLSAWASTVVLFVVFGVLSLIINGLFSLNGLASLMVILLVSNVIAFFAIAVFSFSVSILTFKRGLDPDNFVIPLESCVADALTTMALFVTLMLLIH